MDAALLKELSKRATGIRRDVVSMIGVARSGYVASALSATDILVWLYGAVLSIRPGEPLWEGRDRFVFDKASASPALYAVLAERGFFRRDELWGYRRMGSTLQAFADARRTPGVDVSCGSLGMGPGVSFGLASALRDRQPAPRVFCFVGESELLEGAVWETVMNDIARKLENLTLIVDRNGLRIDGACAPSDPLEERFKAFSWASARADGHDMDALDAALASLPSDRARVLIAETVGGKGIPSLERAPLVNFSLDRQTTDDLLKELDGAESEEEPEAEGGALEGEERWNM
jgi:transketolase